MRGGSSEPHTPSKTLTHRAWITEHTRSYSPSSNTSPRSQWCRHSNLRSDWWRDVCQTQAARLVLNSWTTQPQRNRVTAVSEGLVRREVRRGTSAALWCISSPWDKGRSSGLAADSMQHRSSENTGFNCQVGWSILRACVSLLCPWECLRVSVETWLIQRWVIVI